MIGISKRYSIDEVRFFFTERGYKLLTDNYENNKQKLQYVCKCGNESVIKLNKLLNGGSCKDCGYKKASETKTNDYLFVKKTFEDKGFLLLSETYINSREKLKYLCRCGRESEIAFCNINSTNGCKDCWLDILRSDKNPFRNIEWTPEEREQKRKSPEYAEWRTRVFEKDNFTCVKCNQWGGNLNAHHLNGFHWCKEERFDVNNGVTLCSDCHTEFHRSYGKRNNTAQQFNEWTAKQPETVVFNFD